MALRLKQIRQARGFTQASLATRAGVDTATISRIERGVADPTMSTLERLASALYVPTPDLFVREPTKTTRLRRGMLER